jgi:hypothetical protein
MIGDAKRLALDDPATYRKMQFYGSLLVGIILVIVALMLAVIL